VFQSRAFRIAILPAAILVLLAALYTGWWYWLAGRWTDGIARWTAAAAGQGWTVTTGTVTVGGFPGALRIALPAPKAADAAGEAWIGPPVTLTVSPFAPLAPHFAASGRHVVALPGRRPLDLQADSLTGVLTIVHDIPAMLAVEARQIVAAPVILDGFTMTLRRLEAGATDPTAPVLAATAEIDRLALPEGAVPMLDKIVSVAHLALRLRGAIPLSPPRQALAAWRDAGGTVEIDSADIDWPPVAGAGNATLALDGDLQPELAGTATLRGLPAMIDRMVELGTMEPGPAVAAKVVLGLASSEGSDGMPENKVAVTIQNRVLSLGPARILKLPEVKW
jgi:hypothetical protein